MSTLCSQWEGARFDLCPTKIFIKIKTGKPQIKTACLKNDDADGDDDVFDIPLYPIPQTPSSSSSPSRLQRNDACSLLLLETKIMILRKTQNQNDADDANDAESGIWYRDIPKTASLASSVSLSSHKDAAGGLGYTPEMCMWMTTCYASKICSSPKRGEKNQRGYAYKFVYAPE